MAKVKFQLEMGGEKVRTLEQLREHFDIFEGMEYVENGKLVKWLKSRGEDELAETVSALDPQGTDCPKKLWRALGIAFDDQKYQLWDVLFRTSEGALGIAFNDQKYQQLLQIKRGEEERRKVQEKRTRTTEAEKKREQEEKAKFLRTNKAQCEEQVRGALEAWMETVRRGVKERQKAEERRKNLSKTNVVSADDYLEWARMHREQ